MQALKTFGAPLSQIDRGDFTQAEVVFQIGVSPRRIDLLTSIDGVNFAEAWRNRLLVQNEDVSILVLSKSHLIQNKETLGRPQDKANLARLRDEENE